MKSNIYTLKTSLYFSGMKRDIDADKEIENIKNNNFTCFKFFLRHNESNSLKEKVSDLDGAFLGKLEKVLFQNLASGNSHTVHDLQTKYHILGFLKFFKDERLKQQAIDMLEKYCKRENIDGNDVLYFSAINSLIMLDKDNSGERISEITTFVAKKDELKEFIICYLNFYYGGLSESIARINKFGTDNDNKLELFHLLYPMLEGTNPKLLKKLSDTINIEQIIESAKNVCGDVQKVYSKLVF